MTRVGLWRNGLLLVALLSVLAGRAPVKAQPSAAQDVAADWEFGFDLFQSVLESRGLTPMSVDIRTSPRVEQLAQRPDRPVLILTGEVHSLVRYGQLRMFLQQGGRAVVATDQRTDAAGLFRIAQGPVRSSQAGVAGFDDCLQVQQLNLTHPVLNGVETIVTNRSGWVSHLRQQSGQDWRVLARTPGGTSPVGSGRQPLLVAAEMQRSAGGLVVLADSSPLSNGMLWYGDNLALAMNLAGWLSQSHATRYLWLHDGRSVHNRIPALLMEEALQQEIRPEDIPLEALSELPAETLLEIGNEVLAQVEDSNVANELLSDRPRNLAPRFYRRLILLCLLGAIVAVLLYRGWHAVQAAVPWGVRSRVRQQPKVVDPVREMDYVTAARVLAADVFRQLTGSVDPVHWKQALQSYSPLWTELTQFSQEPSRTARALETLLLAVEPSARATLSAGGLEKVGAEVYHIRELYEQYLTSVPAAGRSQIQETLVTGP